MTATVKYIDAPEEWRSANDWDSHRELLYLATQNMPTAMVYEFGMGDGSTPLLLNYCQGRLLSVENNIDWRSKYTEGYQETFAMFNDGDGGEMWVEPSVLKKGVHTVYSRWQPIVNWLCNPNVLDNNDRLVFIDNAPASERLILIERIKGDADVIVVHDTEEGAEYVYGLKEILSKFKYRLDYQPEGKPHTTAVSNTVNVCEWITPQ